MHFENVYNFQFILILFIFMLWFYRVYRQQIDVGNRQMLQNIDRARIAMIWGNRINTIRFYSMFSLFSCMFNAILIIIFKINLRVQYRRV